jgi:hypothetical protein
VRRLIGPGSRRRDDAVFERYERISTTKSPAQAGKQRPRDFNHGAPGSTSRGRALHRPHARSGSDVERSVGGDYAAKARKIKKTWDSWLRQYPFKICIEDSARRWTRRHRGVGPDVLPYERQPSIELEEIRRPHLPPVLSGKLWKCSSIAYLQLQKEKYPELSSSWNPYLAYEPLSPDCTDKQLDRFLAREEEPICGMCPAHPEPFAKPSPLIPLSTLLRNRNRRNDADAGKLVESHA